MLKLFYQLGPLAQLVERSAHQYGALARETRKMNGVNSGKPKPAFADMVILSQALSTLGEGAETSGGIEFP